MKINFHWQTKKSPDEIDIIAHPETQPMLHQIEKILTADAQISVINPQNNRTVLLNLHDIEQVESLGHLCKIVTEQQDTFLIQKRLKAILAYNWSHFYQINNTTILNLTKVTAFAAGSHARLEVHTSSKNHYVVSRHYAKQIKEKLS